MTSRDVSPTSPHVDAQREHSTETISAARPTLWKSLEDVTPQRAEVSTAPAAVRDYAERQFPSLFAPLSDPFARRDVLKVLGASVALAGFTACTRQPDEKILPYGKSPEALVPGKPLYYASAMPWSSGALGVLVESHMGRPTKIEGNDKHPSSLGATDCFTQASVLGLYDPDRSTTVTRAGRIATWNDFLTDLTAQISAQTGKQGAGLRLLTNTVVSPTLAARLQAVLAAHPNAKWIQYEPVHRDQARAGALAAFGEDVVARPDFAKAKIVVALEGDFLGNGPASVATTREFAKARRARKAHATINRLYAAESSMSLTGAMADRYVAVRPSELVALAAELAKAVGASFGGAAGTPSAKASEWAKAAAADLVAHKGECVVVAGDAAPADVHALVHALNAALGNVGKTVSYVEPAALVSSDQTAELRQLATDMTNGAVEALVMIGVNPVYDAPADLGFAAALAKVAWTAHHGLYQDETAELCLWHVNDAHYLEAWGDARSADGSVSIVQPLIAPLYGGKSALELVNALLGKGGLTGYEALREQWQATLGADGFEAKWRSAVHDGLLPTPAFAAKTPSLRSFSIAAQNANGMELVFRADDSAFDGRFANNAWLQELPRPLTKLVWDNAALVSLATATRLGVTNGDMLELSLGGRSVRVPVWVTPGQADECVTVQLGYGRRRAGSVGNGVGVDVYPLRGSAGQWAASGLAVAKTGETYQLVSAQKHHSMENRDLVRVRESGNLEGHAGHGAHGEHPTVWTPYEYKGNAWALVIDLAACTGCNACTIACQAENNIPVVGKSQVANTREMHWIRLDRYFEGDDFDTARVRFQPVPCMHCENAPCEVVCPVGATTHGDEGLNEMVYNRCVGTRYCLNNCPYKVRRFNFLLYQDFVTESVKLQRNPDVSVRSRGVMEKCTYCIQRINQARIQAGREGNRPIADGEIVTACQTVCPAEAIVFGDKNDPKSKVSAWRAEPHHYGILEDVNTKPRTTYLAKVENTGEVHGAAHGADLHDGASGAGTHGGAGAAGH
ncbi:MAG: 4Fe-4S dicluster domain-containing protein [Planctomycetes bacterium]|nr:4Fe-4S dicluster domain-containing protein [Planctomycetota bacterium]